MIKNFRGALPYVARSLTRELHYPNGLLVMWAALAIVNLGPARPLGDGYLVLAGVFVGFFAMELAGRAGRGRREYRRARSVPARP